MYRSSVDIPEDKRRVLIELLNKLLANATDLYTQAKHAHWNVKGRHFISSHELFDDVAKHAREQADELAERIATLGGYARGTARLAVEQSELPEFAPDSYSGRDCIEALVDRLATQASALRRGIEQTDEIDAATQDILIEALRQVEFDMWFLESHLERPGETKVSAREEEAGAVQPS